MVIIKWPGGVRKWRNIKSRWKYRNIIDKMKRRETVLIGYLTCKCGFLNHNIVGNIEGCVEVMVRRGRIRMQLLDDWKKTRVCWIQNVEAQDGSLWSTRIGSGHWPVVKDTTNWMNEWLIEWMNIWLLLYVGMENLFWSSPHITNFYPKLRGAWYIKSENLLL